MVGLTRSTAIDTAAAGVTVNAVAPGWIDTASASDHERVMGAATPVGRSGTADEVAYVIAFLAGEGASTPAAAPRTPADEPVVASDPRPS
ncbi:SDR family oxidoreductase [Oceanitalea stevensii]|uniref:SDR family oxidoreductase n=1 Tax=Oceanitalea stevensii TaxID=2763072 RepID=UPI002044E609|nr:SDR family oxidoreductase [Oceanitalea stevensii]